MGYSPGFLLEIARFRALRNLPQIFTKKFKSSRKRIWKPLEAFQEVSNDFQHLTKSAIYKTMGYSPGFLLEIARFRAFRKLPQIFTEKSKSSRKCIWKPIGGVSGSFEWFPALNQIRHFQNHGLSPRVFAENWPISAHWKFLPNLNEQARTKLEIDFQAFGRRF